VTQRRCQLFWCGVLFPVLRRRITGSNRADNQPRRSCYDPHRKTDCELASLGASGLPPAAHDAFVPIARDSVHAPGKCIDTLVSLAFLGPRPNQALRLDLCE
jgi:hypothetical protein